MILEFEGVTETEYRAVNAALGIDPTTGEGDRPAGLVSHSGGLDESGHLVVMEVWDTPKHQERFKGGITEPPSSVTWIELIAHHHPGG